MAVTNYMGLTAWDLGDDQYNYIQLANNFIALDEHDHSPSKGQQIQSAGLANSAVITAKIANLAVTTSKYALGSVNQAILAKPSVGTDELYDNSVVETKILDGSVAAPKLDPALIPIGQCILWYRATASMPLPGGFWEHLDGRAWSAVTNKMGAGGVQLNSGNMPDTRNAFILGAALSGTGSGTSTPPAIGATGGSMTIGLAHSHNVAGHSHTVPDHVHGLSDHNHGINADGGHNHGMFSRLTRTLSQDGQGTSYLQTLYVAGFNTGGENAPLPYGAAHSHGGYTTGQIDGQLVTHGSSVGTASTSVSGSTTDSQLSSVDIRPKYVGFLILCRVR